jgi:hypothetical protein
VTRYVGTYTWEVPTETLWKFHLRARSVDNAGNVGRDVWKDEVKVDLEKPAAGIIGVRGAAGGSTGGGGRPASVKEPSTPAREPDPEPITPPPTRLPATKPPVPPVTGSPSGPNSPSGPPPVPPLPTPPAKMMD